MQDVSWKERMYRSMVSFGINFSRRSDGTINRLIMNLFDLKAPPSKQPLDGIKTLDTMVDSTRNLWFRLYIPSTTTEDANMPVIIYFHGGGFAYMSANSIGCDNLCRRLSKQTGAVIISVNYRLTPEHKYPCQYEDGFDVLKFIDISNSSLEAFPSYANLNQCFIAGDSAGGNLAHHVTVKACEYEFRNMKFIGLIAIQPFFGGEERTESEIRLTDAPIISVKGTDWLWKAFLPEGSDRDHPASNVFGPKSVDISRLNFPATMVFVGGVDILHDWQIRYYEGLKKCGKEAYLIEYPNAFHSFYAVPEFPETALFMQDLNDFVQKQSAK
ncbi:Alpha/beta hydrolase-3 [Corchorus olitorius]|uniref:Alpha/beta hydrolase-3 n=1 Tax=Corchorus olitorius TaxID=93759 RepID=A0A1R3I4N7_9ROSI|nr:Alpha/beta hydrolase-3 [Corchorus olitorius]